MASRSRSSTPRRAADRSERAADVWPGGTKFPYLRSVPDDVHEDEVPWVLTLTLDEIRQALVKAGFGGDRLRDVEIDERTRSGRVARLHLPGLRPDAIAGDPFRMAIGAAAAAQHGVLDDPHRQQRTLHRRRLRPRRRDVRDWRRPSRTARRDARSRSSRSTYPGLALMSLERDARRSTSAPVSVDPPRACRLLRR